MSRDNVELFRKVLSSVGEDDLGGRLVELCDPDVEWRSFFAALLPSGEYHGHDGLRDYARDLEEAWEDLRVDVYDVLDAGDVVVGIGRVRFRGKGSGVESASDAGWMLKFRAGKVLVFRAFRDPAEAFEAVGLAE
jgi:ketosteroid isomerase-like protein